MNLSPSVQDHLQRLLKTAAVVILAGLIFALCSCSNPMAGPDQFDIGLARHMQAQSEHSLMATRAMAASRGVRSGVLEPLQPLEPLR